MPRHAAHPAMIELHNLSIDTSITYMPLGTNYY